MCTSGFVSKCQCKCSYFLYLYIWSPAQASLWSNMFLGYWNPKYLNIVFWTAMNPTQSFVKNINKQNIKRHTPHDYIAIWSLTLLIVPLFFSQPGEFLSQNFTLNKDYFILQSWRKSVVWKWFQKARGPYMPNHNPKCIFRTIFWPPWNKLCVANSFIVLMES